MSKKENRHGGKKVRNYGGSGGMAKHRRSGTSHNHAHTIRRNREEAQRIERQERLRKKRKGKMFSSVRELFDSK